MSDMTRPGHMSDMTSGRRRAFRQVDVFTERPFAGNPVAVVLDADGLDDAAMQAIARWTNLSETTFVLPPTRPEADWRLRIFTPARELPFAGHPTIGTTHALLEAQRVRPRNGRLVQECAAGLVALRAEPGDAGRAGLLFLTVPTPRHEPLDPQRRAQLARALGVASIPQADRIDVGPVWVTARLASAREVLALRPDMGALAAAYGALGATGVTVFGAWGDEPGGDGARWEVRSFAPADGVPEDPVCGSGNGCVAAFLDARGEPLDYVARQGRAVGRDGRVQVRAADGAIEVGGSAVTCIEGTLLA